MPNSASSSPHDLTSLTISHYEGNAKAFWDGTKDHDVSQNINAFLSACPADKPLDVLDLGCGPGRDVLQFKLLGHRPVGLDGSAAFCEMARQLTDCLVLRQDFISLDLPAQSFDGIYANASLFHVPRSHLLTVLSHLQQALREGGILFTSNPRGDGEGLHGQRYGNYMELELSRSFLNAANFEILHHYYRTQGLPCSQQPWLAIVSKRLP